MFRQSRPFSYSPRSVWHFIVRYFAITSALLNVLMMLFIDDVANPLLSSFCCVFFLASEVSRRTTSPRQDDLSSRMTSGVLQCREMACSGPAGSQYTVCPSYKALPPDWYLDVFISNVLFAPVQRKEYSETLSREAETHFRVEVNQCEPTCTNGTGFQLCSPLPSVTSPSTSSPVSWTAGS